jgi:hypothetical protein
MSKQRKGVPYIDNYICIHNDHKNNIKKGVKYVLHKKLIVGLGNRTSDPVGSLVTRSKHEKPDVPGTIMVESPHAAT